MSTRNNHGRLENLLHTIAKTSKDKDRVSVGGILYALGRRSFGPLLVFIGLALAIPGASDIPGVPTVFGVITILTVGQQIIGSSHIWLPRWLLKLSIKKKYVERSLSYAQKPVQKVDRWTTERLDILVSNKVSVYASSIVCVSIAILTPLMEVVLFSANVAGLCIFLFGLAFLARDGLIMLMGFLSYFGLLSLIIFSLAS